MRTIVVLAIALLLVGCASMGYSDPRTAADHQWYDGFLAAQDAGGTCTDMSCRYRDFLHDEVGVPYERMKLVSSRIIATGDRHMFLIVFIVSANEWRSFDPSSGTPSSGAFNYPGIDIFRGFDEINLLPGNARPVEPGGIYHRETNPTE